MAYEIRRMTAEDANRSWEWGRDIGWNPGLYDWKVFTAIDPKGCFAGILDGEMISCIWAIQYAGKYGFIGMYIVAPEHRGRGYGLAIWKHAIEYLSGRIGVQCIGLDGVLANEPAYQTWGFHSAYKTWRYRGTVRGEYKRECPEITENSFTEVADYDRKVFTVERERFLHDLIFKTQAKTAEVSLNGKLAGYAVARPCFEGYKIGPLFADTGEAAHMLLQSLFAELPGQTIFIEVPENRPWAVTLMATYDMKPEVPTVRMYTSNKYQLDTRYVYGITSRTIG